MLRVNEAAELPDDLTGRVGVIAGASAPEELVQAVVTRLAPRHGVEEVRAVDEDQYFPLPRELRDAVRHLAAAAAVAGLAPGADPAAGGAVPVEDREFTGVGGTGRPDPLRRGGPSPRRRRWAGAVRMAVPGPSPGPPTGRDPTLGPPTSGSRRSAGRIVCRTTVYMTEFCTQSG